MVQMAPMEMEKARHPTMVDNTRALAAINKSLAVSKPISREAEKELLRRYKETGDIRARDALVVANLRFVFQTVRKMVYVLSPTFPDAFQAGAIGLQHAVDRFDMTADNKFISYAVWWIRAHVTRYVQEHSLTIRVPANVHLANNKYRKDNRAKIGTGELPPQLMEFPKNVRLDVFSGDHRSDDELSQNPEVSRMLQIEGIASDAAEEVNELLRVREISNLTNMLVKVLDSRSYNVLRRRYGIDCEVSTLKEIADEMGVSRERVRQLEHQAIRKLRSASIKMNLKTRFVENC